MYLYISYNLFNHRHLEAQHFLCGGKAIIIPAPLPDLFFIQSFYW